MDKVTIDYIVGQLEKLGSTMSPCVKEGWEILLRQQYIYASLLLGTFVAVLIGAYFSVKKALKLKDAEDNILLSMCAMIMGTACVILGATFLIDGIPRFLNPEYYVLKILLGK